jgi:hypothetical protein
MTEVRCAIDGPVSLVSREALNWFPWVPVLQLIVEPHNPVRDVDTALEREVGI